MSQAPPIGAAVGVAVACLACLAPVRSVETEGTDGIGMARYRAFGFAPGPSPGDDPAFDPAARALTEQALMGELLPRGVSFVDPGSADLLLAIGVPTASAGEAAASDCRLVVDAIDAETREWLWRGSSPCRRRAPHRLDLGDLQDGVRAIARQLPGA